MSNPRTLHHLYTSFPDACLDEDQIVHCCDNRVGQTCHADACHGVSNNPSQIKSRLKKEGGTTAQRPHRPHHPLMRFSFRLTPHIESSYYICALILYACMENDHVSLKRQATEIFITPPYMADVGAGSSSKEDEHRCSIYDVQRREQG